MKPTDAFQFPENGMSTTPRTDAAVIASGFQAVPYGFQDFARQLEIELAAERKQHSVWREAALDVLCDPKGKACFHGSTEDRAVIDAAMKEASK